MSNLNDINRIELDQHVTDEELEDASWGYERLMLRFSIETHLRVNFFPLMPNAEAWLEPAIEAVDASYKNEWDKEIELPKVLAALDNAPDAVGYMTAYDIIDYLELWTMAGPQDEEE